MVAQATPWQLAVYAGTNAEPSPTQPGEGRSTTEGQNNIQQLKKRFGDCVEHNAAKGEQRHVTYMKAITSCDLSGRRWLRDL